MRDAVGHQGVSTEPEAGTLVGRYQLIAVIGAGGMATVHLALMRGRSKFNKLVVLKIPHAHVSEDATLRAMFLDEARIAARINHPNIVQTYEIVEDGGRDIIVMEYLDGQTLHEATALASKRKVPLPLGMHVRIVVEAMRGLHAAHELRGYDGAPLNLVHRDISPHNIFVTSDGDVKVLDFGIAKAALSSQRTEAGTFKGKVRYMPREQLFGGGREDRRADIFALGVVLWEAAAGSKLWTGTSEHDVMVAVAAGKVPGPRDVNPDADPTLDAIVRKAMAPDPAARYANCLELEVELDRFLAGLPEKHSLRDAGKHIGELFATERARRVAVIEAQIARAEAMDPSSPSSVLLDVERASSSSSPASSPRTPSLALSRSETDSSSVLGSARSIVSHPVAGASEKLPSRSRNAVIVVGVALGLVGVILGVVTRSKRERIVQARQADVAAPSVTAALASPTSVPTSAEVRLSLVANPASARWKLDSHELPSNPVTWIVRKDAASHSLRVEAKGFHSKTLELRYDSDKEIVISLDAEASRAVPAWGPSPARTTRAVPTAANSVAIPDREPTSASPTAAQAPAVPTRPTRRIDSAL